MTIYFQRKNCSHKAIKSMLAPRCSKISYDRRERKDLYIILYNYSGT